MKKLIGLLVVLTSMLAIGYLMWPAHYKSEMEVCTTGQVYRDRETDVFVAKYHPEHNASIKDVLICTDLPYLGYCNHDDCWIFVFKKLPSDGRLRWVRAYVPVVLDDKSLRLKYLDPYSVVSTNEVYVYPFGTYRVPPRSDAVGFGWKVETVSTNYYPLVSGKTGKPFKCTYAEDDGSLVDIDLASAKGNPLIPEGACLYYAVITTNITVRLDNP